VWPLTRLASSRSISPSLVTRSTMLGDTNGDFKRKLLGKTEEKVRGHRSVALNHYCGNGYAFCVMISRKLGLAYVWGGGPPRGRDACGDLAYFPRFFERPPAFFPENRSDNISLRLAGIIGICP